uniref:Uncharacterized protein n=1 Tax=Rhizophora mucronata TaxID=61149 RepID=A0A2P2QRJ4_RHIMU
MRTIFFSFFHGFSRLPIRG